MHDVSQGELKQVWAKRVVTHFNTDTKLKDQKRHLIALSARSEPRWQCVRSRLEFALILFVILWLKKPGFASASSVCYSFHGEVAVDPKHLSSGVVL